VTVATASVRAATLAALILLVVACSRDAPPPEPPREPVVVYAAYEDKAYLPRLFEAYTDATGVAVIVRQGLPGSIVDDVIANEISPPADVLMTPSVLGVYRAAEEGALRPMASAVVDERVPPGLRDPDAFWTALTYRLAALAYRDEALGDPGPLDPASLADPSYRGQLCLSTSDDSINRLLIASLIRRLGAREAEIAVRGWVANLARPVFATGAELREALRDGTCGIGIIADGGAEAGLRVRHLVPAVADVEAIGIARHARNPEGALGLVEWLLGTDVQERHAAVVGARPAIELDEGGGNAGDLAWLEQDAARLAERARYP
jgi:iron(III) transport system substrate-binding protein